MTTMVRSSVSTVCVEANDGSDTTAEVTELPAPGEVLHYLVRARNACGLGTLGLDSSAVERSAAACP